jgi:hypothetical protein
MVPEIVQPFWAALQRGELLNDERPGNEAAVREDRPSERYAPVCMTATRAGIGVTRSTAYRAVQRATRS